MRVVDATPDVDHRNVVDLPFCIVDGVAVSVQAGVGAGATYTDVVADIYPPLGSSHKILNLLFERSGAVALVPAFEFANTTPPVVTEHDPTF